MGVPQYRWREIPQSFRRYWTVSLPKALFLRVLSHAQDGLSRREVAVIARIHQFPVLDIGLFGRGRGRVPACILREQ